MVCAMLEGLKTQTRRIISPRNCEFGSIGSKLVKLWWEKHADWKNAFPDRGFVSNDGVHRHGYLKVPAHEKDCSVCLKWGWDGTVHRLYPDVQPGDRLWVRENFTRGHEYDANDMPIGDQRVFYAASWSDYKIGRWFDPDDDEWRDEPKWTPSIHMPRWASRLTNIVEAVRIERLQAITEEDAVAEGVVSCGKFFPRAAKAMALPLFQDLWERLHGRGAWKKNPFVTVTTFKTHKTNIDQMREAA